MHGRGRLRFVLHALTSKCSLGYVQTVQVCLFDCITKKLQNFKNSLHLWHMSQNSHSMPTPLLIHTYSNKL